MKELKDNNRCFVCGKENPHGLHVDFEIDEALREIRAEFTPADHYQGYEGIVHGGVLSTLLDEAMAKLAFNLGLKVVTGEMTVKFKAPAYTEEALSIFGKLLEENRKLVLAEAKITRGAVVIAEANAKLVKIS